MQEKIMIKFGKENNDTLYEYIDFFQMRKKQRVIKLIVLHPYFPAK